MTSPQTHRLGATLGGEDLLQVPIDSNGNLSTKTEGTDVWGYEWNADNQLIRVVESAMQTLQDEVLGADKGSCCTAYFMNQNSTDFLAWTTAGGPPYIEPRTEKFRNNPKAVCAAEQKAPWETVRSTVVRG